MHGYRYAGLNVLRYFGGQRDMDKSDCKSSHQASHDETEGNSVSLASSAADLPIKHPSAVIVDTEALDKVIAREGTRMASTQTASSSSGDGEVEDESSGGVGDFAAEIGSMVQHYELIRQIGRGGMGCVFLARDTRLGRLVALKFLLQGHQSQKSRKSVSRSERFATEARATARLNHENIIVIHEIGEHAGHLYMVLEYLQGQNLLEWMRARRGRMLLQQRRYRSAASSNRGEGSMPAIYVPPRRACELMIPVVRALVHAHEGGIIHRDLKLSNVMLTNSGKVKVLDFGIAKWLEPDGGRALDADIDDAATTADSNADSKSALIGTAPYMSPEQWGADEVDERTDIWAVGIMLHQLLLGTHPIGVPSRRALASVVNLDIPIPSVASARPELGPLASIIDRCLIKQKADRLPSARHLLFELETLHGPQGGDSADREQNPYLGLSAFQERDAEFFYGRDEAAAEVTTRLGESPLVAVVGPSGAGKSSFVRAGLIPALKRSGEPWESFAIRPGPRPLGALADLLLRHAWGTDTRRADASTKRVGALGSSAQTQNESGHNSSADSNVPVTSASAPADMMREHEAMCAQLRTEPGYLGVLMRDRARRKLTGILIFVDQFEELYTLADPDERDHFVACLAGAADDAGSPIRVVLAMRSDFVDRVSATHAAMLRLNQGLTLLSPMRRSEMRLALLEPLRTSGFRFEEDRLIEDMLDALAETSGALPLLQFTAAKLWDRRDRARHLLTSESYRDLGGVGGALAGYADTVVGAMSSSDKQLARMALSRLVTPEHTRALCTARELCESAGAQAADMNRVLARLIDSRLLVAEGSGDGESVVELVHESLIRSWPLLAQWLGENEGQAAFMHRVRAAATQWERSDRTDGLLWRGDAVREAQRWHEDRVQRGEGDLDTAEGGGGLNALETQYLQAVLAYDARWQRRKRRLTVATMLGLVIVALVLLYSSIQAERQAALAETQAMRAETQAARAETQAARAHNAALMALARERQDDPTSVVSLLRELSPEHLPRGWSALARWGLQAPSAYLVLEHPGDIYAAAVSADGDLIATTCEDDTVRVWRMDGTGPIAELRGHERTVYRAAFSPDGQHLVTASFDQTARIWRTDGTGEPLILRGHEGNVFSAEFSPEGARIVTASQDKTVRIWDRASGAQVAVLRGHGDSVFSAQFSPDGERVVTASFDQTVRVWRPGGGTESGGTEPVVLRGHRDLVWSAAFSPDGARVVSASWDKSARVWNADGSGTPIVLEGHSDYVTSASFSPDGGQVLTSSRDRSARIWDVQPSPDEGADASAAQISAGQRRVRILPGHGSSVESAVFNHDGTRVVTASLDKTVRVWHLDMHRALERQFPVLYGHRDVVFSAAFSPDGERVVTASVDGTARVWTLPGAHSAAILRGHEGRIYTAAFSPDGERIATASADKTVRVWNADGTGEPLILRGHEGRVYSAMFSPDGARIVTASWDKTARIWNADGTGDPLILRGHDASVSWAEFDPSGERVVTTSWDTTARIWRADGTGTPTVLRGHTSWVAVASFSPDGERIVTASWDKTARVWNADGSGQPVVLKGHQGRIYSARFAPDGGRVVTASADKTAMVWQSDGAGEPVVLRGHEDAVNWAEFGPRGQRLVTASSDKTARVWSDLAPLSLDDERFWRATAYCLSAAQRQNLLGVSRERAERRTAQCTERVARARAGQ